MTYPKVLIVNYNSINSATAESITIRNIFAGWPKANLLEVYFAEGSSCSGERDILSCFAGTKRNFLRKISDLTIFQMLNRTMKVSELPSNRISSNNSVDMPKRVSRLGQIRQWLALFISDSPLKIPHEVELKIKEFNPSVIYTSASGVSIMRVVRVLSQKLNIPVLPHFMDNWQESLEWGENPLLKNYHCKVKKWVNLIYERSHAALAISDRMAEVYSANWGIPHYPLMNVADISIFKCKEKTAGSVIQFAYAGGLHLARWFALNEIAKKIDEVSLELSVTCVFNLYCPKEDIAKYRVGFTAECIKTHEAVPHEQITDVYESSDVLVHAETEKLLDDRYAKYSLTTKLPEYLASNRSILYYGPEQLYLTKYLLENDVGFVAVLPEAVEEVLRALLTDADARNRKKQHALQLAAKSYSIERATRILLKAMNIDK